MYSISICLLLAAVTLPTVLCSSWWSLATEQAVFNPVALSQPVFFDCDNSTRVASILDPSQQRLCESDPLLISTVSIGILRGLRECQKQFHDRPWNCSVFHVGPPLGAFVETGTRETAFVNAIVSAGITREVARKCKDGKLKQCGCDHSVKPDYSEITKFGGCGDNDHYGVEIARKFTDHALRHNDTALSQITMHNNKVGRQLVTNTSVDCICHGISGSCTVQTCFKKVPEIEDIGEVLLQKYDTPVQVEVDPDSNKLKSVAGGPQLAEDTLGFVNFSPNLCKRDISNGVYGTAGRQCYPDMNDHTSCTSMCCGEPPLMKVVQKYDSCCKFVWCCRVECNKCNFRNVTEYYCK